MPRDEPTWWLPRGTYGEACVVLALQKIHYDHGRGTLGDGPDDPDCPCRGSSRQSDCAKTQCGFCRVAESRLKEEAKA